MIEGLNNAQLHHVNEISTKIIASKVVKPGDTVFDCGANVGFHTFHLSELVGPSGRVHAFEPNPELWRHFVALPNVRLWPYAVGDRLSAETFILPIGQDQVGSLVDPRDFVGDIPVKKLSVVQVPIDILAEAVETPVSFIKIDVERHEAAALLGLQSIIRKHRPVIVFENNTAHTQAILDRLEYAVVNITNFVAPTIPVVNVIAVPIDRSDSVEDLLPSHVDFTLMTAEFGIEATG